MTIAQKISDTIAAARAVSAQHPNMVAIVCETKLSAKARKSSFGFSFRPIGHADAVIGRTFANDDLSVSTVVAIA